MLLSTYGYSNVTQPIAPPLTGQAPKAVTFRFALAVTTLGGVAGAGYLSLARVHFSDSACTTRATDHSRRVSLAAGSDGKLSLFATGMGVECEDAGSDDLATTASTIQLADALQGASPLFHVIELRAASAPCPGKLGSSFELVVDGIAGACAPLGVDPMQKMSGFGVEMGVANGAPWNTVDLTYDDVDVTYEGI
jgi:hypothetical protein